VSQAVDGAYADPEMMIVAFAAETGVDDLFALRDTANTLMAGSCPTLETGGSMPTPTSGGVCRTLKFPTDPAVDFVVTVPTAGVAHVAFFTAHVPTEFEKDTHYFMSTDLATDIEPISDTNMYCKVQKDSAGILQCQKAFFTLQSHHDYCSHDFLDRYQEELMHMWESKCKTCAIERGYVAGLSDCPKIDCSDPTGAKTAYFVVSDSNKKCTPASFEYAFEWGGVFDTPDASYKWVSQAVDGAYADPEMKMVVYPMSQTNMHTLYLKQEDADDLMNAGPCPELSTGGTISNPPAAGACYTLKFPTDPAVDFVVTVTTGSAHTAFFTAHVPTEFERDIHYLMQDVANLATATPNEPLNEVPTGGGGHDHGRRLSATSKPASLSQLAANKAFANPRKRGRKLTDPGSCCTTVETQGAWKSIVAYHDLCDHDDVPPEIEIGFHDYEESCENYFCNAVPAGYRGDLCPSPPSPPPVVESDDDLGTGAIAGIAVAAAIAVLMCLCVVFMIMKERAGAPVFSKMDGGAKASA